ncbi:CDP-glycerol glycerophosphotransferase family protein [Arthrobacter sp. JSM 101049]|uniref:CDP-glycerol glycerophosphotransferase family protein n=1 Tax=Arthrobacter sp. JSM 101049 TaxID=929097 RepID=UPI003569CDD3
MALGEQTKKFAERARKAVRAEIHAAALNQPLKRRTVLYESFSGNGMLCNPEALFHRLLELPEFASLTHIWVLSAVDSHSELVDRYRRYGNVKFVEYQSAAYFAALASSEYLVNNATFPWQFVKRAGQKYINTWHGTPLKTMGYDVEGGSPDTRNIVRNFLQADYLVAANEAMADMYLRAYKMGNIYRGTLITGGYPRIDRQQPDAESRRQAQRDLHASGVVPDDRRIILFAPTWKGASFYSPANDAAQLLDQVRDLESRIDTSRFRVLLKVHQVVYRAARDLPGIAGYLVPNGIPTNVMLGLTDILVTDYSSIYVDFLATGRPVYFFTPDAQGYQRDRGSYTAPEDLPGPTAATIAGLAASMEATGAFTEQPVLSAAYTAARSRYCADEDGSATDRLIDVVFRGRTDAAGVRTDHGDGRESILIYLGGMASNGITTSVLNLLDNIDHDRFDVSAFYSYSRQADKKANAEAINPRVRLLPRQGGHTTGFLGRRKYREMLETGLAPGDYRETPDTVWDREWHRCFGDAEFDYIVDFSGYGPFWDYILLRGRAKQHTIWLHNDLAADAEREVAGQKALKKHLTGVFSTYKDFDRLVSVSPELNLVNREHLASRAAPEKFTSAVNTCNAVKVRRMGTLDPEDYSASAVEPVSLAAPNLHDALLELSRTYDPQDIGRLAERQATLRRYFPADSAHATTFVTVGRLSPEKNHARMIRAFAHVHAERPDTRLMIIGSGPLRQELGALAESMGLGHAVVFTGQQRNPYMLMHEADCFVMSSDYEGQPMVILEAKILGLPVVSTAFGSVHSALPDGSGHITGFRDEELAAGMVAYLDGQVPVADFDAESYNRMAMDGFYRAIGAQPENHESMASLPGARVHHRWSDVAAPAPAGRA